MKPILDTTCKPTDDEIYGRAALAQGEPWIVPAALTHLRRIMHPTWKVFEWGSGGSTAFWSHHCRLVVSVEHEIGWFERTQILLTTQRCPANWLLYLVPGIPDPQTGMQHHLTSFRAYADAITKCDLLTPYDLIFVDGEASSRGWCLEHALSRVGVGGWLLLDNSNWLEDHDFGPQWQRWDYVARGLHWIGQTEPFDWWTSLLQRKG